MKVVDGLKEKGIFEEIMMKKKEVVEKKDKDYEREKI